MKAKLIKKGNVYFLDELKIDGYFTIANSLAKPNGLMYNLSIKNCQTIERGYDLDELAEEYAEENAKDNNISYHNLYVPLEYAYRHGFQKCLELMSDKKFSEEDVRRAIEIARNGSMQEQHNGYGRPKELRFVLDDVPSDYIIQSLQQTEWDVEVLMENSLINGYRNQAEGTIGFIAEYESVPKLDADGCLILKTFKSE